MPRLSVVLPAYNEATRLPRYLRAARPYLAGAFSDDYEVLVVDDGSEDGLAAEVGRLGVGWPQLTLLHHEHNQGKGAALRTGMAAAQGEVLLFADADGATPIEEEAKLRAEISRGAALAVGSRLLDSPGGAVSRSWRRDLPGRAFALLARSLFHLPVWDTQCGFKMFRREVVAPLLRVSRQDGYLFDLEVLAWASRLRYRIAEVPVRWRDVPGSKVRLCRDGWCMLRGTWQLYRTFQRTAAAPTSEDGLALDMVPLAPSLEASLVPLTPAPPRQL